MYVNAFARQVRHLIRTTGFDVCRFPGRQFGYLRQGLLAQQEVSLALDVGANRGQWALEVRKWGFRGRIASFEPGRDAFEVLASSAEGDPNWSVRRLAIGEEDRDVILNVASNSGASSSVLPMLDAHRQAAPHASYVGTETVPQMKLASIWHELVGADDRVYLKADVQGYEKQVLAGAGGLSQVVGIELELSFVELYARSPLITVMLSDLGSMGFGLAELDPTFHDPSSGRLLQANGIFVRI